MANGKGGARKVKANGGKVKSAETYQHKTASFLRRR
jgi:hypothetical protein